jgi:hypothetical protein
MKRQAASALVAIFLMFSHVAQALVAAAVPCAEDLAGSAALLGAKCAHDDAAPAAAPVSGHEVPEHCVFCASGTCQLAQTPAMAARVSAPSFAPPESFRLPELVARHFVSPLFENLRPPD